MFYLASQQYCEDSIEALKATNQKLEAQIHTLLDASHDDDVRDNARGQSVDKYPRRL